VELSKVSRLSIIRLFNKGFSIFTPFLLMRLIIMSSKYCPEKEEAFDIFGAFVRSQPRLRSIKCNLDKIFILLIKLFKFRTYEHD
jgi:hypothetical protein